MRFEIYQTGNSLLNQAGGQGGWRWRLRAANGEPVASGESYTTKANCLHAVGLLMDTSRMTPVLETVY